MRQALYDSLEIAVLVNTDEDLRRKARELQTRLMDQTRSKDNLLEHERKGEKEAQAMIQRYFPKKNALHA